MMPDRSNVMAMRHAKVKEEIQKNPFISDEELAQNLKTSIHTVRSDRRKIGIPEVRKRGREMSDALFRHSRSLSDSEIVGEILEIELDKEGLSLLETSEMMGLKKSGIVRGHVLFAQANTLANAIVDCEMAVTVEADVRYTAPAYVGEKLLAKAKVIKAGSHRKKVQVVIKSPNKLVFEGIFRIYALDPVTASHLHIFPQGKGVHK
jgi:acyl-coenzyme A thioesterase PaaI-like protein